MKNKIVEIQIRGINTISKIAQKKILKEVALKEKNFNFTGFVKIIIEATSNGRNIKSVVPIEGNVNDYWREELKDMKVPTFDDVLKQIKPIKNLRKKLKKNNILFELYKNDRNRLFKKYCEKHNIVLNNYQNNIIDVYFQTPRGYGKTFIMNLLQKFERETGL